MSEVKINKCKTPTLSAKKSSKQRSSKILNTKPKKTTTAVTRKQKEAARKSKKTTTIFNRSFHLHLNSCVECEKLNKMGPECETGAMPPPFKWNASDDLRVLLESTGEIYMQLEHSAPNLESDDKNTRGKIIIAMCDDEKGQKFNTTNIM